MQWSAHAQADEARCRLTAIFGENREAFLVLDCCETYRIGYDTRYTEQVRVLQATVSTVHFSSGEVGPLTVMSRLNAPAYGPLFSLRHLNLSNLYKWNTRKHPSWEHRSQSQGGERLREESLPEQKGWTKQDTLRELCVTCCRNSRSLKSTEGTVSEGMTGKYDVSMIKEMVAASDECCIATFIASHRNDQRSGIGSSTIGVHLSSSEQCVDDASVAGTGVVAKHSEKTPQMEPLFDFTRNTTTAEGAPSIPLGMDAAMEQQPSLHSCGATATIELTRRIQR